MKNFLQVSLRQSSIFISSQALTNHNSELNENTAILIANLRKLGYGVSQPLLSALNQTSSNFQNDLLKQFAEIMKVDKNWTPLVKGWDKPTGESFTDQIITFFANLFEGKGTKLPCGHIIPKNTFPLERYNGCPFCGTPFEFGKIEHFGQGGKLKVLNLWQETDIEKFYKNLLTSKTALDATQIDSLKILLGTMPLPKVEIEMKETLMLVIDLLIENNKESEAQYLLKTPTDILRYLWYKHTGFLQIIKPKTIISRKSLNAKAVYFLKAKSTIKEEVKQKKIKTKTRLKIKFNRKTCRMVANWFNSMPMGFERMCEIMHPQRSMWVRFIRALRLAEYSKKPGFERLKELIDVFYNERYLVWQGQLNELRSKKLSQETFTLLKQRPGIFARSLFSNILWFGKEPSLNALSEIIDQIPPRLLFTLNELAKNYFDSKGSRTVKPLGGISKNIPNNKLLRSHSSESLKEILKDLEETILKEMFRRYKSVQTESKTIYIDPRLDKIPMSIGDRSETVQDLPSALMGTRFPVLGDNFRIFMHWGVGMPAQHLDMDLSCYIAYPNSFTVCSFSHLVTTGCKHSGDIRSIPNQVGTAEYIEIDVPELQKAGAQYVTFTCNAYSSGSLALYLVVGWMNSENKMVISEKTGVAYDPSCVEHQVRVTQSLTKGLVFGVLDVAEKEIVWLEMPFSGQVAQGLDFNAVRSLLKKLENKLSIGKLLRIKAQAQNLVLQETTEQADEIYDLKWANDTALVTQLLVNAESKK
jgi:hypothetical protein